MNPAGLALLGVLVGAFGTLIGAGGGFVLVPVLLLLYPKDSPALVTGISLAVVCLNAASGSFAYSRMRRVDFRSGWMFAAATIPGAVLGAMATARIPRRSFDLLFGVLLLLGSLYLLWRPLRRDGGEGHATGSFARQLTERDGTVHRWSYEPWLGIAISVFVGFASSVLGIGGGIIHVPVLTQVLGFPVHVATATSHFVLAVMALAGTIVHLSNGELLPGLGRVAAIGAGVLVGAQIGAALSKRVGGVWIMRSLALALGLVGVRILLLALQTGTP
ncbi:MAG: sulfite exporter TauE/SafE family protein [Candidatus Eisenbacteria bacterium]|nr:sulfite exporter TauE/SafE family protein [Candidatus Eisenbacteria bacterium]